MYQKIIQELNKLKNPAQAKNLQRFFKTGKGEYGGGDIFLGLKSQEIKDIAKKYYRETNFNDIKKLLNSEIHEHRVASLRILVIQYEEGGDKIRKKIFDFYLKNTKNINNWDLVDMSAPNIVGQFLFQTCLSGGLSEKETSTKVSKNLVLYKLAKSKNLWERRIAVLATFAFIREKDFRDAIKILEILLKDKHDLIHKAVGWMLREMGKRDKKELIKFLDKHALHMPRTMLRYSIEKLPEKKRKYYLNKK